MYTQQLFCDCHFMYSKCSKFCKWFFTCCPGVSEAVRRRSTANASYSTMLDDVQPELRSLFERSRSCLSIGAGYGQRDIEFLKRCVPGIETVTAVEPAPDCAAELVIKLQHLLPMVRYSVHQDKVQHWRGMEEPNDIVLMFHFHYYLTRSELCHLMERIFKEMLRLYGYVVMLVATPDAKRPQKVINPLLDDCPEVAALELVLTDAGFHKCLQSEYHVTMDMTPPFEDEFVAFLQADCGLETSIEDARAILEREYSTNNILKDTRYLLVYRKLPALQY